MNVAQYFYMDIFTYSCPYGYKKLNLTIFGVIPDLIWGRIDKLSFKLSSQGIFIGGSMRVV